MLAQGARLLVVIVNYHRTLVGGLQQEPAHGAAHGQQQQQDQYGDEQHPTAIGGPRSSYATVFFAPRVGAARR